MLRTQGAPDAAHPGRLVHPSTTVTQHPEYLAPIDPRYPGHARYLNNSITGACYSPMLLLVRELCICYSLMLLLVRVSGESENLGGC